MKYLFPHFIFLLVLMSLAALRAEEEKPAPALPLETLVTQALAENPELRFYEAEIAAASGERKTAGAWANPEVGGEIGRKRTTGDGPAAEGMAWAVSVSQTFEWPGRVSLRKAIADRQVGLSKLGLEQFRTALAAQVRGRGYQLLAAQRREEAANEVAARGEELVATLVQREPAGVAPLLETRSIEAAIIKLKREAIEASQSAQQALFALNQLRGRPISEPLKITEAPLAFPEIPPVGELLHRAGRNNFELKQREMELAQQGFKVALSENEAWPSITVGPSLSRETAGDTETVAGVAVSVPLPLWNRNRGAIETAHARRMQAAISLKLSQREVERQIREKAAAYSLLKKEIARWNPGIAGQLREAAALADRHYRLGAVPVATYLEMQESYLEALEAIYATQHDASEALASLENLTGSKIQKP